MADLFIHRLADCTIDVLYRRSKWAKVQQVKQEALNLSSNLVRIRKILDDAEKERLKEESFWKIRLDKITGRMFNLEDVLDEWIIEVHKSKSKEEEKKKKVRSFIPCLDSPFKNDTLHNIYLEIKKSNDDLELVLKESVEVGLLAIRRSGQSTETMLRPQSRPMTDSSSAVLKVFGRESDMTSLLNHLLTEDSNSSTKDGVKVLSLVGIAGSGKTAIAQMLFNDDQVSCNFDHRAWACVNDFDMKRIAESLLIHRPDVMLENLELEKMLELIKDTYSGRKFFIVLDDVLNADYSAWKPLMDLLCLGAPESRILLTTKNEQVATAMGSVNKHTLGQISSSVCWQILKQTACSERPEFCKQVAKIGKKIAKKCYGLPLAAKIMGSHLRLKETVQEWKHVLEEPPKFFDSFFAELYSSYSELSSVLKRCFSYCVIFPKGTDINVEKLIRLWMVEGFLGPSSRGDKILEMEGLRHFNNLEKLGFFHEVVKDSVHNFNKITSCKIPDMFHEFAQYIADDSGTRVHRKMRSKIVVPKVDPNEFGRWNHVRALVLSSCHLQDLPSEVKDLIFLRHLDLSGNPLKQLPQTVCDLYYLEFLDVHFCYLLVRLPERIGNLQNLRHLRINNTTEELQHMPGGFGELTSIRTLDVFCVGGRYDNNTEKLENLNDLEEVRIVIYGKVDFGVAKLDEKSAMENLELCFVGEGRDVNNVPLIEPPNLQLLKFDNYPGSQLPEWILAPSLINNLKRLTLRSALSITSLPALGKLSSLEFLWLYHLPSLQHLGREFFGLTKKMHSPGEDLSGDDEEIRDLSEDEEEINDPSQVPGAFLKLGTLRIEYLENWETWEDLNEAVEKDNSLSVMPCLEELIIADCQKLAALPRCIPQKTSLKIVNCSKLQQNSQK